MNGWTPEPWVIRGLQIESEQGASIADLNLGWLHKNERLPDGQVHSNAQRIVACVNACAGLADPERDLAALREQNAALAGALEACLDEEHGLYELGKRVGQRAGALTAGAAPYVGCEESDSAILATRALTARAREALARRGGGAAPSDDVAEAFELLGFLAAWQPVHHDPECERSVVIERASALLARRGGQHA